MNKKIYYATRDHDETINKNADIYKFNSYEDMETYLRKQFDDEDQRHIEIKTMAFDEYWIESHEPIHVVKQYIYHPFTYNQLSTNKFPPSGSNDTWITPKTRVDVYVATYSKAYLDKQGSH